MQLTETSADNSDTQTYESWPFPPNINLDNKIYHQRSVTLAKYTGHDISTLVDCHYSRIKDQWHKYKYTQVFLACHAFN